MSFTIACWNIEKDGQSSSQKKQTKVSSFIDYCVEKEIDLIFLCEIHSTRQQDFEDFLDEVYGHNGYKTEVFYGGHSNCYAVLAKEDIANYCDKKKLKGINRFLVLYNVGDFLVGLAHFKSGKRPLTKSEIQNSVITLEGKQSGSWLLTGDMNWDYTDREELDLKDQKTLKTYRMWHDCTQKKGGILDWAIAGQYTTLSGYTPFKRNVHPEYLNMDGPDHKPAIYKISRNAQNRSFSSNFSSSNNDSNSNN